jgi:phage terminase large subunit-like protein
VGEGLADALELISQQIKQQADDPNIYSYVPHTMQEKFHKDESPIRLVVGGNRAGKTHMGVAEDIWWATDTHPYLTTPKPPVKIRVVGVDFNALQQIIIPKFKTLTPISQLKGNSWASAYDVQRKVLRFANGSFIEFMSQEQKLESFAGTSRHAVHYDEECPKDIFEECQMRLLDTDGCSWMTLTPVKGITWLYDDLYLPAVEGRLEGVGIIKGSTSSNPHLNKGAIERLMGGLDHDTRMIREEGEFVAASGLVYKAFSPQMHVIEPINLQRLNTRAKIYMGLDHGYNAPTAIVWVAIFPNGKAVVINERYVSECVVEEHAKEILAFEKRNKLEIELRIADPATAQRQGVTGTSIQSEYAKHGVYLTPGNNDVLSGVDKLNTYFRPPMDPKDVPAIRITENCANLVSELKGLRWATYTSKQVANRNNLQDKIHKKNDHASDALRYVFSLLPSYSYGENDIRDRIARTKRVEQAIAKEEKRQSLPTYAELLIAGSNDATSFEDDGWDYGLGEDSSFS